MWAPRLSGFLVVLLVWPVIFGKANGANGTNLRSHHQQDALQNWMAGLNISLPGGVSGEMPMDMGTFTVGSGYCTGLKIGGVESEDLSVGLILEFGLRVSGVGISCFIVGDSDGPMQINITLDRTALNATFQINPYTSGKAEDLPLPLGQLNVTSCIADLVVTDFTWAGAGPLAKTLDEVGDGVAGLIGMFVNEPLCEGLKGFLEVNVTAGMHRGAELAEMMLLPPPAPEPQPPALKTLLDWAEYPPVAVVKALLAERFTVFSKRVLDVLDVHSFHSTLYESEVINLALSTLHIEGVSGEEEPNLEIMANQSSLGVSADLAGMKIRSGLDFAVTLGDQPAFFQHINVTLGLRQLAIGLRAMVDKAQLDKLELDDALSSPRCLAQCTEGTANPPEDAVAIEDFHVELRPLLEISVAGSLETKSSQLINMVVGALFREYLPTVNALVNGGLGLARGQLDTILWEKINSSPPCSREDMFFVLSEAQVRCLLSVAVAIALLGVPAAVLAHFRGQYRSGLCEEAPRGAPRRAAGGDQSTASSAECSAGDSGASAAIPVQFSLACDPGVPRILAVYFPFAVLAVMALFLYADLDIGTTVTLVFAADGATSRIGPLFSFSLVSTIVHAWSSEAYIIAVLTVIASGVWPFGKLTLLLVAWLVPPQYLSLGSRGKILQFLDSWGKYSFLDSWFLVLTLSAFALEWESVGTASLKIQTTPAPAFYAFLAATLLSLVLGHVASEYHRSVMAVAVPKPQSVDVTDVVEEGTTDNPTVPAQLCRFAASSAEHVAVLGALSTSVLLATFGTVLSSFSFEVSGLAVEFLFGDSIEKSYSLLSVGMSVASGRYNETGLIGLEVVFVVLAIAVPAVLIGLLFSLWLVPMRLNRQRSVLNACRMLDAWASMDVAALVLAIACFEFAKMAEWLVYKGNLAAPCRIVRNLTHDECMKIELHAFPALVALFLAGICLVVVPKVSLRKFGNAIRRRSGIIDAQAGHQKAVNCSEECGA